MRHPAGQCNCPLSSKHCETQTDKRNRWFQAVETGDSYDVKHLVQEICGFPASRELLIVRDEQSRTALHVAAASKNTEMVAQLLTYIEERKDNLNILNMADEVEGMTAMLEASRVGSSLIVKALAEAGAKWYLLSKEGKQCKDYAEEGGFTDILEYIEQHGVVEEEEPDPEEEQETNLDDFDDENEETGSGAEEGEEQDEGEASVANDATSERLTEQGETSVDAAELAELPAETDAEKEEEHIPLPRNVVDSCMRNASSKSFFALLEPAQLRDLFEGCNIEKISAKHCLVRPVSSNPYMILVLSGRVQVIQNQLQDGAKMAQTDIELKEGDTYGETILLLGDHIATKFTALEDSTLIELTARTMGPFLLQRRKVVPDLGAFLALPLSMKADGPVQSDDHAAAMEMAQRIETFYELGNESPMVVDDFLMHSSMRAEKPRRPRAIAEIPIAHHKIKQGVNVVHAVQVSANQKPCFGSLEPLFLGRSLQQSHFLAPTRVPSSQSSPESRFERRSSSGGSTSPTRDEAGVREYTDACAKLGIIPKVSVVLQLRESHMRLHDRSFGPKDAVALGKALGLNKSVKHLLLSQNPIGNEGCWGVVDGLIAGRRVENLQLEGNRLGRGSAMFLQKLVQEHQSLTCLKLASNSIGDKGAAAIAQGLMKPGQRGALRILDLSNNGISNRAAKAISEMLAQNDVLEELDLTWNHILDEGSAALLRGMAENRSIVTLSLSWNRLGRKGGDALGLMLGANAVLQRLDVSNCGVLAVSAEQIAAGLRKNSALKVVKLGWNPLKDGVPTLMSALADCPGSPLFTIENCQFDILHNGSKRAVDERNPSGRYSFDLAAPGDRAALQTLLELGMKEQGANWRNERVNGKRFTFPEKGAWEVPNSGTLELDFVHLDPPSELTEGLITDNDVHSLLRQLNKVISSPGRIELIRQAAGSFIFTAPQVVQVLSQLYREEERVEAIVHLFARMKGRRRGMQQVLLKCFRREDLLTLHNRLGPEKTFDEARPDVQYRIDLGKSKDRTVLFRVLEYVRSGMFEGSPASFVMHAGWLYTYNGACRHVDPMKVAVGMEAVEQEKNSRSHTDTLSRPSSSSSATAVERHPSSPLATESGRPPSGKGTSAVRRSPSAASAASKQGTEEDDEGKEDKDAIRMSGFLVFTLSMKREVLEDGGGGMHTRLLKRIQTSKQTEGSQADARPASFDMEGTSFQKGADGLGLERTGSLRKTVLGMISRKTGLENLIPADSNPWKSLSPMPRTLKQLDSLKDEERQRKARQLRSETNAKKAKKMIAAASLDSIETMGAPLRTPVTLSLRRRRLKPWEIFTRCSKQDFHVHLIKIKETKQLGHSGLHETIRGRLGEASCVNYEIDLSIPIKVHTIPRIISFSVSPGGGVALFANTSGLPLHDNYLWKGSMVGTDRIITVRPTDVDYKAGRYHISVVSSSAYCEFVFTVHVAPYTPILREPDISGERQEDPMEEDDSDERNKENEDADAHDDVTEGSSAGSADEDEDRVGGDEEAGRSGSRGDEARGGRGKHARGEMLRAGPRDPLHWLQEQKKKAKESHAVLQRMTVLSQERMRSASIGARVPAKANVLPLRPMTSVGWDDRRTTPGSRMDRPGSQPLPPIKQGFLEEKSGTPGNG